ncbi:MAG: aminotransferase class I/II-fold pyridoxal phosphate-dependent enzyme [Hydrotalea flava]|uniref:pyridoxal phosphate-dependent aminotransferase n=1 Tax=Hydrotalea lipotrueae TaxID=2803817 RepID=UPI0016AF100D|nr:pyridoxal phosphate-dependent aminotransferase [Hydrotalea lipotrueae]NIM36197.1 aminotransferase class I/II-fold pyridoxal phosphate-dependent enzyme [Hydrotalea flava]NIM39048.1 aminotransferase class I/II-fold pyridoxal phosphate-dependent enzyme [Hydrotalea flava]NIN04283.1 aminotransferase class I/II-fold pyridoxal phosphate-dependent enzyme [Hydrotalea flava]NIN15909.1 aminotransferase class I/II-fold pyridoxal phosphate-dependent enzyme [Hydrotalea flava]NIO94974.1 aminotransferase c
MVKVSKLAESLIGSEIVKLGNAITERIKKGEKIYNYTIGDFDSSVFPIPTELEQYIIEAYQKKFTNYPPADGIALLRKAVSAFLAQREGLVYAENEIQIASGGRPLIYTLFETLVDAGDKVIYGVPSWNNNHYVHLTQGQHCTIECTAENNFMPTAEAIAPHIKGATLLCLCTPQNPTGTTLSKTSLEQICDMVLEENNNRPPDAKKLYVMFDQMYWTLTYGDIQHYNPVTLRPAMREYTIFIDGISKAFAATGVRVGWAVGPAAIIAKMKAILSHLGAWAPMAEQHAVAKYLGQTEAIDRYLNSYKQALEFRLNSIYQGIKALQKKGYSVDAIAPQAAIYLTVQMNLTGKKTKEGQLLENQDAVTGYILSEAKIAIVPFYAFGAGRNSSWYRLSVGTCREEDIVPMLNGLEKALAALQ